MSLLEQMIASTRHAIIASAIIDSLSANAVPADAIVIGALGTKTISLAGDRTLGAHPYLTVPAHTRYAREVMGKNAFLAPEHKVVLTEDEDPTASPVQAFRTLAEHRPPHRIDSPGRRRG